MIDYEPAVERIDQHIGQWMEYKRIPGTVLLVTDGERILHTATFGYAHKEEQYTPTINMSGGSKTPRRRFVSTPSLTGIRPGRYSPSANTTGHSPIDGDNQSSGDH